MLVEHRRSRMSQQGRYLGIRHAVGKGIGCESVPVAVSDAVLHFRLDVEPTKPTADGRGCQFVPIFARKQPQIGFRATVLTL